MQATTWRGGVAVLLGIAALGAASPARGGDRNPQRYGDFHVGGRPSPRNSLLTGSGAFPDAQPRYHNGAQVICADCHTLHASQSHPYDPPRPGEQVPYLGSPSARLLKAPDPLDLCISCHDGHTFAPDVVGADANGLALRSAGKFDEPGIENPRGHDLGRGLPSGEDYCLRCHFSSGTEAKVTCIDCHDPHGNEVARNLRWASWPDGTPDLGLFVNPAATGMSRYEAANVSYGSLNSDQLREPTSICIDCHHVFSGADYVDPDGDGIHSKHPSYDSEHGSTNNIAQGAGDGGSNPAHWQGGAGSGFFGTPRLRFVVSGASGFAAGSVVDPQTNGVLCLTCHQAHGSDQAFGIAWQLQNGYSAPGCDQCHLIADVAAPPPTTDVPEP